MKLHADEQDAQAVLNAFPEGLFESLDGLQVKGKIKYDLNFYLDSKTPDSLKFTSALTPYNFKIVKWGKLNLQKINDTFVYTPYEYGKPMRDITIGPLIPITPLFLSFQYFKNALLTSETLLFIRTKVLSKINPQIFCDNFKEKNSSGEEVPFNALVKMCS